MQILNFGVRTSSLRICCEIEVKNFVKHSFSCEMVSRVLGLVLGHTWILIILEIVLPITCQVARSSISFLKAYLLLEEPFAKVYHRKTWVIWIFIERVCVETRTRFSGLDGWGFWRRSAGVFAVIRLRTSVPRIITPNSNVVGKGVDEGSRIHRGSVCEYSLDLVSLAFVESWRSKIFKRGSTVPIDLA